MENNTNLSGVRDPGQLAFPSSVVLASEVTPMLEDIVDTSLVVIPRRKITFIPAPLEFVVDVTPRESTTVTGTDLLTAQVKALEPLMTQSQAIKTLGLPLDSPWADVERARANQVASTEPRGGRRGDATQANAAYSVYLAARTF